MGGKDPPHAERGVLNLYLQLPSLKLPSQAF